MPNERNERQHLKKRNYSVCFQLKPVVSSWSFFVLFWLHLLSCCWCHSTHISRYNRTFLNWWWTFVTSWSRKSRMSLYSILFYFIFFYFFFIKRCVFAEANVTCLLTGIKSMQVQTKIKKKRNKKREEDDEKPRATTVCMHVSLPQKKTAELVSERFNLRIR